MNTYRMVKMKPGLEVVGNSNAHPNTVTSANSVLQVVPPKLMYTWVSPAQAHLLTWGPGTGGQGTGLALTAGPPQS